MLVKGTTLRYPSPTYRPAPTPKVVAKPVAPAPAPKPAQKPAPAPVPKPTPAQKQAPARTDSGAAATSGGSKSTKTTAADRSDQREQERVTTQVKRDTVTISDEYRSKSQTGSATQAGTTQKKDENPSSNSTATTYKQATISTKPQDGGDPSRNTDVISPRGAASSATLPKPAQTDAASKATDAQKPNPAGTTVKVTANQSQDQGNPAMNTDVNPRFTVSVVSAPADAPALKPSSQPAPATNAGQPFDRVRLADKSVVSPDQLGTAVKAKLDDYAAKAQPMTPPVSGSGWNISSDFAEKRILKDDNGNVVRESVHTGIDVVNPPKTNGQLVVSPVNGTAKLTEGNPISGNYITIRPDDPDQPTVVLAHLQDRNPKDPVLQGRQLKPGEETHVQAGQPIARVGHTGDCYPQNPEVAGSHLHADTYFEIDGAKYYVDPKRYMPYQ